jgi:DNA-binding Lrp family transcriptional regulator
MTDQNSSKGHAMTPTTPPPSSEGKVHTEEHKVSGERLLSRVKELVHEGNIRRITIKNDQGHTLMEVPLTVGVVGAVLLPIWVAIGALAALAANYTLVVEKVEKT